MSVWIELDQYVRHVMYDCVWTGVDCIGLVGRAHIF